MMNKRHGIVFFHLLTFVGLIFGEPIELEEIILAEHTPVDHLLLTVDPSTSNQRHSYRFVSPNHREIQQYFLLNSTTGQLRVGADIDREKICLNRHTKCKFLLKIFELFNEKLYHIPIVIKDINDHRPRFPYRNSEIELHLSENSPILQSKIFVQTAYDLDQVDDQTQLKYDLKSDETSFPFRLETSSDGSNRLAIVLIENLDRERIERYRCVLQVTDTAGHVEKLKILIHVDDVNDQSPM